MVLIVIFNDHEGDFETLLQNHDDVCNNHKNIQTVLIEIFKIIKFFVPTIMGSILKGRNNTYNLEIFKNLRQKEKQMYILV